MISCSTCRWLAHTPPLGRRAGSCAASDSPVALAVLLLRRWCAAPGDGAAGVASPLAAGLGRATGGGEGASLLTDGRRWGSLLGLPASLFSLPGRGICMLAHTFSLRATQPHSPVGAGWLPPAALSQLALVPRPLAGCGAHNAAQPARTCAPGSCQS